MGTVIGIDLGTTFSAVAAIDEVGRPVIIKNGSMNITPSAVMLLGDQLVVGENARRAFQINQGAMARFKRDMGTDKTFSLNGATYTPTDLSALVLHEMKKVAEADLGPIEAAVVTIPANFAQEAREATMDAAKKANLPVKYIINEPTAAALYYGYESGEPLGGVYVVYDLGGGTFDISIIRVAGQDIEVLASNGIHRLGGDDFDRALMGLVARKFKEIKGVDLPIDEYNLNDAEKDKIDLSEVSRIGAKQVQGKLVQGEFVELSRAEFEEMISSLVAQTEMMCESTIEEAGVQLSEIRDVFLAGGSTRIPAVRNSIERVFGKRPKASANVDEVVALGAALYAAYRADDQILTPAQKNSVRRMKISEVSNHCFGTIALTYDPQRNLEARENSILIPKGQPIPSLVKESYFTVADDQQSVRCTVTQSVAPESDPRFVNVIWEGDLSLPSGRPRGQEIEVQFSYDENQMMHCSFRDMETSKLVEVKIKASEGSGSEASEIDKFLVE